MPDLPANARACRLPPCADRFAPRADGACQLPLKRVYTSHCAADVGAAAARLTGPVLGLVWLSSQVPPHTASWLVLASPATVEFIDLVDVPDPPLPQLTDPAVLKVCTGFARGLRSAWVLAHDRPLSCAVPTGPRYGAGGTRPWLWSWWDSTDLDFPLCDEDERSNWSRRPLRKAQSHYAALNAYLLVVAAHHLCATSPAGPVPRRYLRSLLCTCLQEACTCAHVQPCLRALFNPARFDELLASLRPAPPPQEHAHAPPRHDVLCSGRDM